MSPPQDSTARANRLARETSPYLLQHAHNPVDWYAWGPEAFDAARKLDRPIFLSVGYSTCYWCHVMERQSFENAAIAAEMNSRFVNIKVDREERPDVDQLYMNAVQAMTGQGGWPMSVFLTPDLKPFFGGTYFPPADGYGRVGFPRLLAAIDEAWKNRRADVQEQANNLLDVLRRMAEPPAGTGAALDSAALEELVDRSTSDFDPDFGGFGAAPKFPRQTLLELLLARPNQARMTQLTTTLDAMAAGGIHDPLGGAFHRYSTDQRWLVPHFEIMLYDNAMLAWVYAEAMRKTGEKKYAAVARGILDFVLREMTSPDGAFYTAFDAEVDAEEGRSYLWTEAEIEEALGAGAETFFRVYGIEEKIIYQRGPVGEETEREVAPMRQALYERRRRRKQPLLDTKILTAWNGLMIRALAHAGEALEEPVYLAAAAKAADYLLHHHRAGGVLQHGSRDGQVKGDALLDDYAFLAQGLLRLGRRDQAEELFEQMCRQFLDRGRGGFFFTAENAGDILVRQKTAADSPLPSGNAVAAMVGTELGRQEIAAGTIAVFVGQLERFGEGMSAMVKAAAEYVEAHGTIKVAGGAKELELVKLSAEWAAPDRLLIHMQIAGGFHIGGPEAGAGMTPTRLTVAGAAAESVAGVDYPPPVVRRLPFADEDVSLYDSAATITVRFDRPMRGRRLTVLLHCQACDEQSCRAAEKKTLVVE
jgi:hypothetical protein